MKKLKLFLFLAFAAGALKAQTINDPNAELRNVKGFHAIQISNAIELLLSQSNDEAVAVSASEAKYREKIVTRVEDGVLIIYVEKTEKNFFNGGNKKMKAYVSFRMLDKISASGACDVQVNGTIKGERLHIKLNGASDFQGALDLKSLELEQSGASDAKISGKVGDLKVSASGACDLKGYDLVTETCNVRASGASDVKITCNKELNVVASGASGVNYRGSAVIKEIHTSGASNVSRKG